MKYIIETMKVLRDLKKNQNEKRKNGSIVRSNNNIVQTVSMQCTSMVQPLLSVRDQILHHYLQLIDSAVGFILHTLSSAFTLRTAVKGGAESVRLRAKSSEEGYVITPLPHRSTATAFVECVNSVANFH